MNIVNKFNSEWGVMNSYSEQGIWQPDHVICNLSKVHAT